MRRLHKMSVNNANPLWNIYRIVRFPKVLKNTITIELAKYVPSMAIKRWIYVNVLHLSIGATTSIAYKVMLDIFYPELIQIGNNSVIGYNTTILTHEALVNEFRYGLVKIGDHTLIGANVTILPGVTIGHHVTIAAGTIVSKDVPDYTFAYGNPILTKQS